MRWPAVRQVHRMKRTVLKGNILSRPEPEFFAAEVLKVPLSTLNPVRIVEHVGVGRLLFALDQVLLTLGIITGIFQEPDLDSPTLILGAFKVIELIDIRVRQAGDIDSSDCTAFLGKNTGIVGVSDAVATEAGQDGGGEGVEVPDSLWGIGITVHDPKEDTRVHLQRH